MSVHAIQEPIHSYRAFDGIFYSMGYISSGLAIFISTDELSLYGKTLPYLSAVSTVIHLFAIFKSTSPIFGQNRYFYNRTDGCLFLLGLSVNTTICMIGTVINPSHIGLLFVLSSFFSGIGLCRGFVQSLTNDSCSRNNDV